MRDDGQPRNGQTLASAKPLLRGRFPTLLPGNPKSHRQDAPSDWLWSMDSSHPLYCMRLANEFLMRAMRSPSDLKLTSFVRSHENEGETQ